MICGHCQTPISAEWKSAKIIKTELFHTMGKAIAYITCPKCEEVIISIQNVSLKKRDKRLIVHQVYKNTIVYPKPDLKISIDYLPKHIKQDYTQARLIVHSSPQAAAVMVRRLLQNILQNSYQIKEYNLQKEIKKFRERPGIPEHLAAAIDAIRFIGNFGAHPSKDIETGRIIEVDREEAEWLLELIEDLLDFTYIQPKITKERLASLNRKLIKMGKPPMKSETNF